MSNKQVSLATLTSRTHCSEFLRSVNFFVRRTVSWGMGHQSFLISHFSLFSHKTPKKYLFVCDLQPMGYIAVIPCCWEGRRAKLNGTTIHFAPILSADGRVTRSCLAPERKFQLGARTKQELRKLTGQQEWLLWHRAWRNCLPCHGLVMFYRQSYTGWAKLNGTTTTFHF